MYETWAFQADGAITGTPVIDPATNNIFFGVATHSGASGFTNYSIYCVSNAGNEVWRVGSPSPYNSSASVNSDHGLLYLGSDDGLLQALQLEDGSSAAPGWSVQVGTGTHLLTSPALESYWQPPLHRLQCWHPLRIQAAAAHA